MLISLHALSACNSHVYFGGLSAVDFLLEKHLDRAAFDRLMSIFPDIESKDDWCGNGPPLLLFHFFPCRFPYENAISFPGQARDQAQGKFETKGRGCVFFSAQGGGVS
jgi:hypothetical protein